MPSRDTDDAPLSVDLMTNLLDTQPKLDALYQTLTCTQAN